MESISRIEIVYYEEHHSAEEFDKYNRRISHTILEIADILREIESIQCNFKIHFNDFAHNRTFMSYYRLANGTSSVWKKEPFMVLFDNRRVKVYIWEEKQYGSDLFESVYEYLYGTVISFMAMYRRLLLQSMSSRFIGKFKNDSSLFPIKFDEDHPFLMDFLE